MTTDGRDWQYFLICVEIYTTAQIDLSYGNSVQVTEASMSAKLMIGCAVFKLLRASGTDNDYLAQLLGGVKDPADGDNQIYDGPIYTKGTLADGVYTNEWVDLKFVVPEGFQTAPEEIFNAFSAQDSGECRLPIMTDGGQTCNLLFLDTPISLNDPKPFLEQSVKELATELSEQGFLAQWDNQYGEMQIAGNEYTGAHITINTNGVTSAESLYMRQIDSKRCCILITGACQEANNALAAQFTSCRG